MPRLTPTTEPMEKKSPKAPAPFFRKTRSVLIYGPIEPKLTRDVVTQLLMLDAVSPSKAIKVFVNSPGGLADDGFAIYDVMRYVRAPVYTICSGMAASAATIVLLGAARGRRLITPHARVMLHQPSTALRGTAADIAVNAKELLRLRKKSTELYARETGRSTEQVEKDLTRDYWMNAEEAVAYRIVDRIVTTADDVVRA
jgi:ATP-dependent Clp protease protease subunit